MGLHTEIRVDSGGNLNVDGEYHLADDMYRWATDSLTAWTKTGLLASEPIMPGQQSATLDLERARPGESAWIYPPAHLFPVMRELRTDNNGCRFACPDGDRKPWLAYGDSITGGWCSPVPGGDWVSRVSRTVGGLEAINLGFAGAARGEEAVAWEMAGRQAGLISIAFGTNCWSSKPFSVPHIGRTMTRFIEIVRTGHPDTPIAIVSPILRPDAEKMPNEQGASLADLRHSIEAAVASAQARGDRNLILIPGLELLAGEDLCDGLHPSEQGQERMAEGVAPLLAAML